MTNEVIPLYRPGNDVTATATTAITGGTFVAVSGAIAGALVKVATATAALGVFGVAARDAASGKNVPVIRGAKVILPVMSGAAIASGAEVQVGTGGKAITLASGVAVGRALDAVAAGDLPVFIELY